MEIEITNNKQNGQFEYRTDEHLAYLAYRMRKKTMFFMHTKVPDELAGQGIASALASTALNYAKEKKYLGEICLNPNLPNLEKEKKYRENLLDVTIINYKLGKTVSKQFFDLNLNRYSDMIDD